VEDLQAKLKDVQTQLEAERVAHKAELEAQKAAHQTELTQVKHQTVVDTVHRSEGIPFPDAELEKSVNGFWPPPEQYEELGM
jgi:hypothetical protein